MKYHYYINDVEVFPKGEWSINYQRNEGQIFFRRIFEGELTFGDADYDLIKGLSCEIATFDIYCGGSIDWQGQFQYPYLLGFDDDSCTVVLTPEVVDEYSCIMNHYDTDFIGGGLAAAITPQLWTCPAPGALVRALASAWPLIGNTGVVTDDYFTNILNSVLRMDCGLTLRSSFMLNDDFANGDNYAAAYGTDNYITGANNRLPNVHLIDHYYLKTAWASSCDMHPEMNFKMLEELIRNAFNAYWFIDENGHFRVEHISYFDPAFAHSDYTVGYDLTTLMDRGGRSFAYRRNKYEYETGRMYDQERWSWQYYEGTEGTIPHNTEFEGLPLYYGAAAGHKSDYVSGEFKEKEHACPRFWTDIDWGEQLVAAGEVDTINCDGFLMVDVDLTTAPNYKVFCETGLLSGVSIANGHLSTENLLEHYHTYDRIFLEGNMNDGNVMTFDTAQKHKLQESIEFPVCCDESFDPLNRIRTELGDGEVKAAVQKKQSIEVELWHEFDC